MGRRIASITLDDVRRLESYAWPGNVRELQNVVERAIILSDGARIEIARALPDGARQPRPSTVDTSAEEPPAILNRDEMLTLERDNILRALESCGWRVAGEIGAARLLDVPASTLSSRMKALGIVKPQ